MVGIGEDIRQSDGANLLHLSPTDSGTTVKALRKTKSRLFLGVELGSGTNTKFGYTLRTTLGETANVPVWSPRQLSSYVISMNSPLSRRSTKHSSRQSIGANH